MLLIGAFLGLEFMVIDKDRADFAREQGVRRAEENSNFHDIADGLQQSITDSEKRFEQTMASLKDVVSTETGGDSFCYLDFQPALNNVFFMTAMKVGRYPMRGVTARILDRAKVQAATDGLWKDHRPSAEEVINAMQQVGETRTYIPDFATSSRGVGGYQAVNGDWQSFDIVIGAFNAEWIERLEMRRVNGKWVKAIMVETGQKSHPYFLNIDKDYPRINGHLDLPRWPRPVKGKPVWEQP